MNKRNEKRMWEGNYFFIHFILLMKKKHFCLVSFSKQSGKEPLLILQTIKMKTGLRKLILPFPSLHQLQRNLTCRGVWTSSSKLKIHFCKHCFFSDCCAFPHSSSGAKTSGKVMLKRIRLLWVWHTLGLTVGSGQPVYRQKKCLEQTPLEMGLRIPTDQMCKTALQIFCLPRFFNTASWTCQPLFLLYLCLFSALIQRYFHL